MMTKTLTMLDVVKSGTLSAAETTATIRALRSRRGAAGKHEVEAGMADMSERQMLRDIDVTRSYSGRFFQWGCLRCGHNGRALHFTSFQAAVESGAKHVAKCRHVEREEVR